MENHQLVLVLDFGGQYNQLIARRVREHNVYCEVKPYKTSIEEIKALNPIGIIFTGGPNSVYEESPKVLTGSVELGVPVLGICYGCQLMAAHPRRRGNRSTGGHCARVRQDRDLLQHGLQAVQGSAGAGYFLDEPRRLHGKGAGGLRAGRSHRYVPDRCHR